MLTPITVFITVSITFLTTAFVTCFLATQRYEHSEKKWADLHQELPETINLTSIQQWNAIEKEMRDTMFPPKSQYFLTPDSEEAKQYYKYFQKNQPKDIQELFTHIQFYGYEIHIQHKDDTSQF